MSDNQDGSAEEAPPKQSTVSKARAEFRTWRKRRDEDATLMKNTNKLLGATDLQYPRLSSTDAPWVRILTIEPGEPTDHIQCSIRCVNLDDDPEYRALSYTWIQNESFATALKAATNLAAQKESDKPRRIVCNSQTILIQSALFQAMLQLRRTQPGDYWVDALCINQSDAEEKNSQIPMMSRIYRSALSVVVWLGPCPRLVSAALARFSTGLQDTYQPLYDSTLILHFWLCRWFSRIWVVQEMCVARALVFYLGEQTLTVEDLLALSRRFLRLSMHDSRLKETTTNITDFSAMVAIRDKVVAHRSQISLTEWLQVCRLREASDPRDVIFGGAALIQPDTLVIDQSLQPPPARRSSGPPPPLPPRPGAAAVTREVASPQRHAPGLWPRLRVDYNAQVMDVLINVAAALLSQPGDMQLLSIAMRARSLGGYCDEYYDPLAREFRGPVPSWVPNPNAAFGRVVKPYAQPGSSSTFAACSDLANDPRILLPAEPGSPAAAAALRGEPTLVLDAARIGTVRLSRFDEDPVWRAEVAQKGKDLPPVPHHLFHFLLGLPPRCPVTGLHVFEALARVMTAGTTVIGGSRKAGGMQGGSGEGGEEEEEEEEEKKKALPPGRPDALRVGLCRFLRAHLRSFDLGGTGWRNFTYQQSLYLELQARYPDQPWPSDEEDDEDEDEDEDEHGDNKGDDDGDNGGNDSGNGASNNNHEANGNGEGSDGDDDNNNNNINSNENNAAEREQKKQQRQCKRAFTRAYTHASFWRLLTRLRPIASTTAAAPSTTHHEEDNNSNRNSSTSPPPPPPPCPLLAQVPGWARTGDTVALVKGCAVPVVLARRGAYLRREREALREALKLSRGYMHRTEARASAKGYTLLPGEGPSQITPAKMEALLRKNEARRCGEGGGGGGGGGKESEEKKKKKKEKKEKKKGKAEEEEGKDDDDGEDDPWVLVGEAFVEGVMFGEALERGHCRFERMAIV